MLIFLVLLGSLIVFEAFPNVFEYSSQTNKITGMATFDVSGIADAIGSVVDIIFVGFLGPINEKLGIEANQLLGVKLGLAIILYLLISFSLKKAGKFDERLSKIISLIISIMFVILIPDTIVKGLFVDLIGGLLGLILLLAIIYFPTKGIYEWSKKNLDNRFTQGMAALIQFFILYIISKSSEEIIVLAKGDIAPDIANLIVAFTILVSVILIIIYIGRALSGTGAGEKVSEVSGEGYEKFKDWKGRRKEAKEAKKEVDKPKLLNNAKQVVNAIASYVSKARTLHQKSVKKGNSIKPRDEVAMENLVNIKDQIDHAWEISRKNKSAIKKYFKDDPNYSVIKSIVNVLINDLKELDSVLNQVIAKFYDDHPEDFKYEIAKTDDSFGKITKNINEIASKLK